MTRIISATVERWPVAGAFIISRGAKTEVDVVVCTVGDGDHVGRGEGTAIYYEGETAQGCAAAINAYPIKGQVPQVSADNLKATIEKHNNYIDSGVDADFKKVMANTMVKLENGPFYALSQFPSVHHTMGGLVIDEYTQVKDIYGQSIAGLYAAGEVTGGIHGTNRLGSNADADACGIGYISGYYVATGEMPDFIPAE